MKYLFAIVLSWSHLCFSDSLILNSGETKFIKSSGKAWVENAKTLRIEQTANGFVVKGLRSGSSLLKIGSKAYQVHTLSPLQEKTIARLQQGLSRTLGLSQNIRDGKIRVQGRLLRWEDWETLYSFCEPNLCEYSMEAEISISLRKKIQQSFYEKFKKLGLSPQKLLFDRPLQALVSQKASQKQRIQDALRAFGVEAQIVSSAVDLEPLIKVQITVAEVKRSETLKYGIQWPSSYSAQVLPKYVPFTDNQPLTLNALEEQGLAKVLATPTILCRSGKDASFLAGGEIPIKIMNFKTQDVIWRKYGILLKISPVADFSGKMSIALETEVSSIDDAHKVDGIPGFFTNRIQSHFDLSEPRTLALSGLIKNDQSESTAGLPGLAKIPVLGALFGSKEFREDRTELVVFVRPEIVSPGSLEVEE